MLCSPVLVRHFVVNNYIDMRNHHTKDKGDVGVLKAQADLATQGYDVTTSIQVN